MRCLCVLSVLAASLSACAAPSVPIFGPFDPCDPVGNADGHGAAARFFSPMAIAADADGNLFVADNANCRIRKVTPDGLVSTVAGTSYGDVNGPALEAKLGHPSAIAVDGKGRIVFWDSSNQRIGTLVDGQIGSLAGRLSTKPDGTIGGFADGQGENALFGGVFGIAADAEGQVYVADVSNQRIRKVSPTGDVTTFAGSGPVGRGPDEKFGGFVDGPGSTAMFSSPLAVAVDTSGNLYVADDGNERIRKVTPAGEVSTFASTGRVDVRAIAVDNVGDVYVVEQLSEERQFVSRVRKFSPSGEVATLAKRKTEVDPRSGYLSIATTRQGKVYVSDPYSIFEVTPDGEQAPLAGIQATCKRRMDF